MILELFRNVMNRTAKAFTFLSLDADDDRDAETATAADAPSSPSPKAAKIAITTSTYGEEESKAKGKKKGKAKANGSLIASEASAVVVNGGNYKLPLVWIDLEMTGLDVEVDRILEVACIITDGKLTKSVEGPNLVIHQSKECLDNMGDWCQEHHGASGLTEKVLRSKLTEKEAEKQLIEFVKKNVGTYKLLLAGNSVYTDYYFLKKYMPDLAGLFHHVLVDVSSVKALCVRWYFGDYKRAPAKEKKHRALDDIKESIEELRYYQQTIFKKVKKK